MEISVHFSKVGWINARKDFDVICTIDKEIEAIKIKNVAAKINYSVCDERSNWQQAADNQIAGSTGKSTPLYELKIESEKKIWYRVCKLKSGWSDFVANTNKDCIIEKDDYLIGVQLFEETDTIDEETGKKEADRRLEAFKRQAKNLFVEDKEKLLLACTKSYFCEEGSAVSIIDDAIALPPIKRKDIETREGVYQGGICTADLQFVTGWERSKNPDANMTCRGTYSIEQEQLVYCDETVIFGGIYFGVFGHLLTECISRLWWILENEKDSDIPIVIMSISPKTKNWNLMFELLGIDMKRVRLITEPTQFKKMIVPKQAVRLWSDYTDKYTVLYDYLRQHTTPSNYDKIYLTRTQLDKNDGINEEYYENFFEQRGYQVIAPEQHTLSEQIAFLAGAKEVVCTEGTLSHLALFCRDGTNLTILRRASDSSLVPQFSINQARKLNVSYIDVTHNFLPVKHNSGVFLYGPTKYFEEYLRERKINFEPDELNWDSICLQKKYIEKWAVHFSKPKNFLTIADKSITDVIATINKEFGTSENVKMSKALVTKDREMIAGLKRSNEQLKQEKEDLERKLKAIESKKMYRLIKKLHKDYWN